MSRDSEFSGVLGGSLPRRYARALIEIAREENLLERFNTDLESIHKSMAKNRNAFETISNDFLPQSERRLAIGDIATKLDLHNQIRSFLMLLVDRERFYLLFAIVREFMRMSDEIRGILRVQVAAPSLPAVDSLRRIEQILSKKTGKTVLARGEERPEMIGGLLLKMEGKLYDGSIRRDLEKLTHRMTKG